MQAINTQAFHLGNICFKIAGIEGIWRKHIMMVAHRLHECAFRRGTTQRCNAQILAYGIEQVVNNQILFNKKPRGIKHIKGSTRRAGRTFVEAEKGGHTARHQAIGLALNIGFAYYRKLSDVETALKIAAIIFIIRHIADSTAHSLLQKFRAEFIEKHPSLTAIAWKMSQYSPYVLYLD